ncbi:MAG: hypothetical protein Tsb0021_13230 [Chlamydiales bacterium]
MHYLKYLLLFIFLSSCCRQELWIKHDYLTIELLASYHVMTPDPHLYNPTIGEKLTISWNIKEKLHAYRQIFLKGTIRFHNREELNICFPISKARSSYSYYLVNQAYLEKCGIQSYKFDLIGDDQILACWRHQLWVELVKIRDKTELTDIEIEMGMEEFEEDWEDQDFFDEDEN